LKFFIEYDNIYLIRLILLLKH